MGRYGGGGNNNDPYSYEVFRKVPFFGSISNYLRFAKEGETNRNSGIFQNVSNVIRQSWNNQNIFPFGPTGPAGPTGPTPPPGPGISSIFQLANLLPVSSANPKNSSLFDLVGD